MIQKGFEAIIPVKRAESGFETCILTWYRRYPDHEGGSPKARHSIALRWLTLANIPNVDISGTQFLLAGDCVRAIPYKISKDKFSHNMAIIINDKSLQISIVTT